MSFMLTHLSNGWQVDQVTSVVVVVEIGWDGIQGKAWK